MLVLSVPSIFWTTLLSVVTLLVTATFIGRACVGVFPTSLQGTARFYLAPVLGLAILIIVSSLLGRYLPIGNSVIVPVFVYSLVAFALICEPSPKRAFQHGLWVATFGIASAASLLGPLFAFGAFNAHNDGFTYLAHSNWLQLHSFGEVIPADHVSPLTTQVALYQQGGFRMGGSFLLALAQSLLNLEWSYEAYPAVVIAAISGCCLAIGFPIALSLAPILRKFRVALLALPAFSLGGLVFGANFGFLPQTLGLSVGAALLFTLGPLFRWVSIRASSNWSIVKVALPSAAFLSAAVFAYSELTPFLLIAVLGSGFFLSLRYRAWGRILVYTGAMLAFTIVLLNTELVRASTALVTQSTAVAGTPVDWSLLGYVAHAFGAHGGAWDVFQWTLPATTESIFFVVGLAITSGLVVILLLHSRVILDLTLKGDLLPAAVVLLIFCAGLLYFRYFVPSPFSKGIGQSWSQFKLSDWAHPFLMPFLMVALIHVRHRMSTYFDYVVVFLTMLGFVSAMNIGVARTSPLIHYYGNTRDLYGFYQKFRQEVLANCPFNAAVYLALNGEHQKFRQMLVYLLEDRKTKSDWTDDNYIFPKLPPERRTQVLDAGDCVVESVAQGGWLSEGAIVGSFRIGMYDGKGQVLIGTTTGAYDRESDGTNWWRWVERKVTFQLQPLSISKDATQSKFYFEYGMLGRQTLTVLIRSRDGASRKFQLDSQGNIPTAFEKTIDLMPSELVELNIETDGHPRLLSDQDKRTASWYIRNLSILPSGP